MAEHQLPCTAPLQRISGMVLRYLYLLRQSWPRAVEAIFWPFLNLIMWGFLTQYLHTNAQVTNSALFIPFSFLIGASLLWEVTLRGSMATMMPLLEEVWSRTLGNLFISPMRNHEFVLGLMTISLIRLVMAVLPCVFIAWALFDYRVWEFGPPLIAFVINLIISGWWLGLIVSCLLVRFGQSAEWMMWMAIFLIQPIVCVFYPLTTLPGWLQPIALALPLTHTFEGLRHLLTQQQIHMAHMLWSFGLNILYLILAITVFFRSLHRTRREQGLLNYGE